MREHDPKIVGPGTWITTHVYCLVCEKSGRKKDYAECGRFIYRMIHAFPCRKCRGHAVKYLDEHSVPKTKDEGSLFEWSVTFHNAVNKRLGKPEMPLEEAREIYENTEVVLNDTHTGETCSLNPQSGESSCDDQPL